ncbi:hypothetical protein SY83_14565 [Paenibacillus swuensis]|uniref:Bleomycin resistance protein n=1 Tax=Paenibacillus swuensis TaxID=1178515 RepID=A0A172TKE4_9BACL|nr:glyoxalase superfamily protein [Paenibacillus swuensis]ANE47287.1 hypothetical protein SY83_14565 [Paenibacillus swuensis]
MASAITPIFRMFDETKAREFYVDLLDFQVDWEHRFEPGMPLYMQVSKGSVTLHLSEHHGDCSPGSAVRMETPELQQLHTDILSKNYKYAKPAIERTPWGTREMTLTDPFGNRIIFYTES